MSGAGYHTLDCLWPAVDYHILVHSLSKYSLSSFLIALLAVNPDPSTEVLLPSALASLSASSLPRIPTWALTYFRMTVLFLPSVFRLSLVSLQDFFVMSVESIVFKVAWLSTWKTIRCPDGSFVNRASAAALTAVSLQTIPRKWQEKNAVHQLILSIAKYKLTINILSRGLKFQLGRQQRSNC
jgi:hypothetical protein